MSALDRLPPWWIIGASGIGIRDASAVEQTAGLAAFDQDPAAVVGLDVVRALPPADPHPVIYPRRERLGLDADELTKFVYNVPAAAPQRIDTRLNVVPSAAWTGWDHQ